MSVLAMGANVGMFIGLIVGGFVSHAYGWRAAFLVVGLPGLILVVLVQMFLKEPQRGLSEGRVAKGDVPPLGQSLGYMWRNRAMRHLIAGSTITGVVTYGLSQWQPAFFMRVHEMPASKVGLTLGLLFGVVGGVGALCGGWLTDKLQNRREAWGIWMIAAVMVMMVPLHVSAFRAQSTTAALALFMLPVFASSFYLGPSLALVQGLAPLRMRSISAAVKMLCMNLIGLGIGPTVVGVLSDLFEPAYGRDSLRMALIIMSLLPIWAAVHFYFCGRHLKAGLAMALED
jgi:predicted MFS family arabinose efflux permease